MERLEEEIVIKVVRGYKLPNPILTVEELSPTFAHVKWQQIECPISCGDWGPSHEYRYAVYDMWDNGNYMQEIGPEGHSFEFDDELPGTTHNVEVQAKVPSLHQTCEPSDKVSITFTTPWGTTQITATSPIPLCFTDDCEGGQRVPCSSNCVWEQSVGICDGRHTELACWEGESIIGFITPIIAEGIITKDISTCSTYDSRYKGTITLNPSDNTMHISITEYPPFSQEMPETMRVTADSELPLWVGDEDGMAQIPCTRNNAMRYGMGFNIAATDDIDRDDSGIIYPHIDYAEGVTIPFKETLLSSATPAHLRGAYEGIVFIEGALGTVHIWLEKFTEVVQLSPPTYDIEVLRPDYAWVQMTCCIRECGEICGTHIPSPSDEYDECHYEIQISEDSIIWKGTGADIEELTPNTTYAVRVRTVDMPDRRCASSDWVIKAFTTLSEEPIVTVDIAASIAAGGIPEAIRTGRDEEITFIVKNLGLGTVVADVFLTFENHDIPRIYPHDITGLEPAGDGYRLPGSGIMILEDAYVAKNPKVIGAGASGSYMITVQLPHDAIPPGEASATYIIKTKVGVYPQ